MKGLNVRFFTIYILSYKSAAGSGFLKVCINRVYDVGPLFLPALLIMSW